MWFPLSLVALLMLAARRSAEKRAANNINIIALAWLQQTYAMPFIIATLFFAKFYVPSELPFEFWKLLVIYGVCSAIDLYCYFKAISLADISYVAPMMSLFAIGNLLGAYFVLGQKPSILGAAGAGLIMSGAIITHRAKVRHHSTAKNDKKALLLILLLITLRSYFANIEVFMLRLSNPISFNFYSSVITISIVLLVSSIIVSTRKQAYENYWLDVRTAMRRHTWPLFFIGVTYTINLLATYQAKILSPNAAYVGSVKGASVLPVMLIGAFVFKERVVKMQWIGLLIIITGLVCIGLN